MLHGYILNKMPSETLVLQVGQCGNQIADQFWRTLCSEHGIGPDGRIIDEAIVNNGLHNDRKNVFFYQVCDILFVRH